MKEIIGRECKHAVYSKATDGSNDDVVMVKEILHFSDGTREPNIELIENYKRPFYVTTEQYRNHKEKKNGKK